MCVERFKAAGNDAASTVLDAVALVGVVSVSKCQESMEALLSQPDCPWPLLKMMHAAKRFVHVYCFVAQSPPARTAVVGPEAATGGGSAAAVGGAGTG